VHRGILLGTGPLVDPGFEGNLLIPLHNLTTNDYEFEGGEGLIWMEFTKLSSNRMWDKSSVRAQQRSGVYKPFQGHKQNLDNRYYLVKAAGQRPIRSSISDAIQDARRSANEAAQSANEAAQRAQSLTNRVTLGGITSAVTLVIATLIALFPIGSLFLDTFSYVKDAREELEISKERRNEELKRLQSLEQETQQLRKQVQQLRPTPGTP